MTKVSATHRGLMVVLALLGFLPSYAGGAPAIAQAAQNSKPAESLYLQLRSVGLDPTRVFRVRDAALDRGSVHFTLDDGTLAFTQDVQGKITGAFFIGEGEVLLVPPNDVERRSMSLFTGMAILEERFATAYFRFNDNTPTELQPGLRATEDAVDFVSKSNDAARNLAQIDALRLLASFCQRLPISGDPAPPSTGADSFSPNDRMLHARLQGTKLGVFDIFYDSTAEEQIEAGQARAAENGDLYYDVWTSFSANEATGSHSAELQNSQTSSVASESSGDPIIVRRSWIDAHVNPPKQLSAEVRLQLDVRRGGSRTLVFELSRFLQIQSVEADGHEVEFIHNPAVEGTQLARDGNDLVTVVLPLPATTGQKISMRFVYSGEVLAEAGKGLLYVGARGNWYPNRGLEMADFDLTFHYPPGWTLVASGKPVPVESSSTRIPTGASNEPEQVSRWISERPVPLAGFNLGKYVRATARAGDVLVETYATTGMERDFPSTPPPLSAFTPTLPKSSKRPEVIEAPPPSPARNAMTVSEETAAAIQYYSERFGAFPYSKLALTQMPGHESQGWPGLVFLSSYAFLTREEREQLHMSPSRTLIDKQIPAHEAAHQWWGDLVSWSTYRDQWISEGLANYCSLMMLQEQNPAGFRQIMENYRNALVERRKDGTVPKDAGPVTLGTRLLSSHFPGSYEAISYGRGTWLFHMLRSMLRDAAAMDKTSGEHGGRPADEPFARSLHELRERYQGRSVSTRELLEVFAKNLPPSLRFEGKPSLEWFLDGWVNGTSLPKLSLQGVRLTPKTNSTIVTGTILQKEAPEELVTSVPLYAVGAGRSHVLLGRVFADGRETSFRMTAPAGTRKILLDPNETILTNPK